MSDVNAVIVQPLKQFVKDSVHLVKKCTKPDRKEFTSVAYAVGVGFLIMGGSAESEKEGCAGELGRASDRSGRAAAARAVVVRGGGRPEPRFRAPRGRSVGASGGLRERVGGERGAPRAGFVGFFVKLVHIPINNILMT